MILPHALIVAGPTASGKSGLALAIAERLGGTIINTDSMQVYRELRVLTARPTVEEEAHVPHRLYGVRPAAEAGSVAWWRGAALAAMDEACAAGRLPILTGGSGDVFRRADRGIGRHSRSRSGGAGRGTPIAGRARIGGATRQPGACRSGHRGAAETGRQPADRTSLGGLAGNRDGARGLAVSPQRCASAPCPVAVQRDPARSPA